MRHHTLSVWIGGLFLVCLGLALGGCAPAFVGPTAPSEYQIRLPKASQTRRGQPLTLTVHVSDAQGNPTEDVPVHFRLPETLLTVARVDPPIVNTLRGQAITTFQAHTAGLMVVQIRVEDFSAIVDVVVLGDTPRF